MDANTDDGWKVRRLLSSIESLDGTPIPYTTAKKLSEVYQELKELVNR